MNKKRTKNGNINLDYYEIALELIQEHHIISFKGTIFIYRDGVYCEDNGTINKAILTCLRGCGLGGKESVTNPTAQIRHIIDAETTEEEYPFNKQPNFLPVKNGVVEFDFEKGTEVLKPHSPEYRLTYKLPINYDPQARAEPVVEYLKSTGCDTDILLQIPAQAILTKSGKHYKKCYLLKGDKNSGKTTFLNLLNFGFFGIENCSNIPLHTLINDCHSSSGIVGKIANISDELSKIKLEDVGQFKSMTGGGMITINRKYHDPYPYKCDVTFIFAANEYPPVSQDEPAFFERWSILEFNETYEIDPSFEDRTFTDKFMSGFLNLVIKKLFEIQKQGIKSDTWNITREKWLNGCDPLYRYINTQLVRDLDAFVPTDIVYRHYENFCKVSNVVTVSKKAFGVRIQNYGTVRKQRKIDGKTKWCYLGFRFKQPQ